MRGFRKAMPFTYGAFVIGGLALAGIPPFSGFFSKDEILLNIGAQGGWHWILYAAGYVAALMTAFYTWRMIFRAFWGEPCEQAAELERGHLWHAPQPTNPATGEVEDTEVGFPGPEHHIAEQALPMKFAMGVLAVLATVGGIVSIPNTTHWFENFLAPTFADSRIHTDPSNGLLAFGLVLGAAVGVLGIGIAYVIYAKGNGELAQVAQQRLAPLHRLFVNKWYFDELIDSAIVRPFSAAGCFFRDTFERRVIDETIVGGTTGLVRAGSAAVRAAQSGFIRYYAALLVVGITGVGFYFLLQT